MRCAVSCAIQFISLDELSLKLNWQRQQRYGNQQLVSGWRRSFVEQSVDLLFLFGYYSLILLLLTT
jgi:hypothetical protein